MADKDKKKKSLWYSITHERQLDKKSYVKLINRVSLYVALGFGISFLVFIAIAFFGGFNTVVNFISSANLWIFSLAFISVFAALLLGFVKWNYYAKVMKLKVSFKKNMVVYLSLYSMNITPGQFGRILVAYTLNRITNIKFINIVPMVIVDIFTDFIGVAIVALIAAIYFNQLVVYVIAADVLLLLPFIFLVNKSTFNAFKKLLGKSKFIKTFTVYGEEYFDSQTVLTKKKIYLVSILFSLPMAFLNSLSLYFVLLSVHLVPNLPGSVFIFSSAQIFGMVSAIPGAIGVTDGALTGLLANSMGLSNSVSSAVTIMTRTATLWFVVVIGAIFLIYSLKYWSECKRGKCKT